MLWFLCTHAKRHCWGLPVLCESIESSRHLAVLPPLPFSSAVCLQGGLRTGMWRAPSPSRTHRTLYLCVNPSRSSSHHLSPDRDSVRPTAYPSPLFLRLRVSPKCPSFVLRVTLRFASPPLRVRPIPTVFRRRGDFRHRPSNMSSRISQTTIPSQVPLLPSGMAQGMSISRITFAPPATAFKVVSVVPIQLGHPTIAPNYGVSFLGDV